MFRQIIMLVLAVTIGLSTAQAEYTPAKVVYDVSSPDFRHLENLMDRAGLLQNIYNNDPFEASIFFVIHEGAIPLFVKSGMDNSDLMVRASSFAVGEIIQFRICRASAQLQGFEDQDFPGFAQMVPMADAEIIKLQSTGYAYLH